MLKKLQITAIILIGISFVISVYLITAHYSSFNTIIAAAIAFIAYISLIFFNDKTKLFSKIVNWIWNKCFVEILNLVFLCIILLVLLLALGYGTYKKSIDDYHNGYLMVMQDSISPCLKNEEVIIQNLHTQEIIEVNTNEGTGRFHIDAHSRLRKKYKGYTFPPEEVKELPYSSIIYIATLSQCAVKENPLPFYNIIHSDTSSFDTDSISADIFSEFSPMNVSDIDFLQMTKILSGTVKNSNIISRNYLIGNISNLNTFVEKNGFIVRYNSELKIPVCVAYKIFKTSNFFPRNLTDSFLIDSSLHSVSGLEYRNSGYDRGTLVTRSDMFCHGQKAVNDTYLTSVITPQAPRFNQRTWNRLEQYTKKFAEDTICIIAGSLFLERNEKNNFIFNTIGISKIAVPTHFYRIISRWANNTLQVLSFIIPNKNEIEDDFSKYLVSIDEVEQKSGMQFFMGLSGRWGTLDKKNRPNALW